MNTTRGRIKDEIGYGLLRLMRLVPVRRYMKVVTNEMEFYVSATSAHFWEQFNSGVWEPETVAFYRRYVRPDKGILDIGGWIGPTVLIGYSYNPKKISVVEADPANYQVLKSNCLQNYLNDKVELHNVCIYESSGSIISFGYNDEDVQDTSTKGVGGDRVKVSTITLEDFLLTKDMKETNIIKIDIEGSEQYIGKGLEYIAGYKGIVVLLSIHTPFWGDKGKTANMLLEVFEKFDVYKEDEGRISREELRMKMLSEQGTRYKGKRGEFFTLILKTR